MHPQCLEEIGRQRDAFSGSRLAPAAARHPCDSDQYRHARAAIKRAGSAYDTTGRTTATEPLQLSGPRERH
jgi:hypothetical protein